MFALLCTTPILAQDDSDDEPSVSNVSVSKEHPFAHLKGLEDSTRDVYHIVFILPVRNENGSTNKDALSLWEGVHTALPRIRKLNSKFKIHIWDNHKDDSTTRYIIKNHLLNMRVDAVIAPFHTRQALIVGEYCKNNKIPMFQVLNPSDVVSKNNPYVFRFVPSKGRLFYDIYQQIISDTAEKYTSIFYLYDSTAKIERRVANYLSYASQKDGTKRLKLLPDNNVEKLVNQMNPNTNNIVLVSQYKDNQVNEIIGGLKDVPIPIKIYGNYTWANNTKLNRENLAALNTLIYSNYSLRKSHDEFEDIKKRYYELASDNINNQVFIGYDVINYITQLFELYGSKFPFHIHKYTYNGVTTNFEFKPVKDSEGNFLFFENSFKDLLKAYPEGWFRINGQD